MTTTTITLASNADNVGEVGPTISGDPTMGVNHPGYFEVNCSQIPNPGTPPPTYVPYNYLGLRFAVSLAQGTVINSAKLKVFFHTYQSDTPLHTIQAQAADDAPAFVSESLLGPGSRNLSSRTWGAQTVAWGDGTELGVATHDPVEIEIGPLLQEVVNRLGWSSGNRVVFVIKPVDSQAADAGQKRISLDSYASGYIPELTVIAGEHYGAAALTASPALAAVPIVERPGVATLQASASLAAAGFVDSAHAALSATAALTAVATVSHEWTAAAVLAAAASAPALAVATWAAAAVVTAQADVVARPTHRSAFADYPAMPTSARPALRPGVGSARSNLRPRPGTARMEW